MKKPSEVFDTPQATGFDRVTHNSRDWEADFDTLFEWTDFDGQIGSFVLVKTKSDYAIEETERNELKAFIHQELQKARGEKQNLLTVGWYKGEMDFGINCSIDELDIKQMHDFRVMVCVAIGQAENMWRRAREKQNPTAMNNLPDQSELDQPTV